MKRMRCLTSLFSSNADSTTSSTYTPVNAQNATLHRRTEILRNNSKLSLAPMMEYTDRHFRHLVRLISHKTLLYTEMVAANAIAHERDRAISNDSNHHSSENDSLVNLEYFDPSYLLRFLGQGNNPEGPSVLQLGGSDPHQLFLAGKTVYELNQMMQQTTMYPHATNNPHPIYCDYTAMNLNCGCPSPKVAGKGCFGAALMQDPNLVRQLTTSLHEGSMGTLPITVKCRIGTDEGYTFNQRNYLSRINKETEYQALKQFVEIVASEGIVTDFQIHARIAVLNKNYSPADNRKVPPLRYDHVRRLATEFPELNISLNGGVETLSGVKAQLELCETLDGVMVGRGFVANPWSFAMADEVLYPDGSGDDEGQSCRPKSRLELLEQYGKHADYEEEQYDPAKIRRFVTKAITQLFAGEHNGKRFRIALDEINRMSHKVEERQTQPALSELILNAATTYLSEEVLYRSPKESYEKMLYDEEQAERKQNGMGLVILDVDGQHESVSLVQEWQSSRKETERIERERREDSVLDN
jgi:tRNA-dihydrouridine synthase A